MKPDTATIDSDLSISSHRIVAALLRDPDQALRMITSESRTLFLLGCAHIDREAGRAPGDGIGSFVPADGALSEVQLAGIVAHVADGVDDLAAGEVRLAEASRQTLNQKAIDAHERRASGSVSP